MSRFRTQRAPHAPLRNLSVQFQVEVRAMVTKTERTKNAIKSLLDLVVSPYPSLWLREHDVSRKLNRLSAPHVRATTSTVEAAAATRKHLFFQVVDELNRQPEPNTAPSCGC
jgi:hypothetical protein